MTLADERAARAPQNAVERMIWLYGRKFWVVFFAGASSFVVGVAAMWIAARVNPETARIVSEVATSYFMAAAGLVTAYSAANAVIERAHAPSGAPADVSGSRPSGAMEAQG